MPLYVCRRWDGIPVPRIHQAIKWIRPRDLMSDPSAFPMPAADLPLLPMLRDLL
jgi:8-oxo-dGTP diphosphatase